MTAYYNELDPQAAAWLRNLIDGGHIAPGDVDERSIADVKPDDLRGYTQCHFFAGLGAWSYALRLAGWSDDRPVWTGSCPCQPFSAAGKGAAFADDRHLWPVWFSLIAQLRPPVVFGENVEAAVGWGWLDLVCSDMGKEGYAIGATVLPACCVGAPHIRQRLWFVADAEGQRGGLPDRQKRQQDFESQRNREVGRVGDADGAGLPIPERAELSGTLRLGQGRAAVEPSHSPWADAIWIECADGKRRAVPQSVVQCLADGAISMDDLPPDAGFPLVAGKAVKGRAAMLRAIGNAIVPQVAAEFIRAYMSVRE